MLQFARCSVCVAVREYDDIYEYDHINDLRLYSMLNLYDPIECVAVCCSVLQCVADLYHLRSYSTYVYAPMNLYAPR